MGAGDVAIGVGGTVAAIVTAAGTFLFGRSRVKIEEAAEHRQEGEGVLSLTLEGMQTLINGLSNEVGRLRTQVEELRSENAGLREEMRMQEARHQARETELVAEIAVLRSRLDASTT